MYGWTFDQWAIAAGLLGNTPKNLKECLNIKLSWARRYSYDPIEKPIIATLDNKDERKKDYDASYIVFTSIRGRP